MKRLWSTLSALLLLSLASLSLAATTSNSTAKPTFVDEPTAASNAAANLNNPDAADSDDDSGDNAANDTNFGEDASSDDGSDQNMMDNDDLSEDNSDNGADD